MQAKKGETEVKSNYDLMREDLDESLKRSHIEPSSLSTFSKDFVDNRWHSYGNVRSLQFGKH